MELRIDRENSRGVVSEVRVCDVLKGIWVFSLSGMRVIGVEV